MVKDQPAGVNELDPQTNSLFLSGDGKTGAPLIRLHKTVVICHIHYPDLLGEFASQLACLENNFDLYISISRENSAALEDIFTTFPAAKVLMMENIGRDINPFMVILKAILPFKYDFLLKIHTKRSPHRADGDEWRQDMVARLLGTRQNVKKIQDLLIQDPHVGVIAPKGHVVSYRAYCGASRDRVLQLATAAGVAYSEAHDFPFVAGTMFWAKPSALAALASIPDDRLQYEDEVIAADGALVHALERFIGLTVHKAGLQILETDGQGGIAEPDLRQTYPYTPPSKQLKLADVRRVVFFSAYDERFAIEHLRITAPYRQAGIEVIAGMVNGEPQYDLITKADSVVIQREFPRNLPVYDRIHQVANGNYVPIIYDLDDLLFDLPSDHPERQAMDYTSALVPMLTALVQADLVTVSTERLKDTLSDLNENIIVLPNYLDDHLWALKPLPVLPTDHLPLIIGYMGSSSHTPDLEMVAPVLLELLERYGERLAMHVWGTELPESLKGNSRVTWSPSPTNNYADFATFFQKQRADIFIAPLADNLFNRCKSGLKFLEYSALGVPGVYSALDGYEAMVTHGEDGFLASSPEEWKACLSHLVEDPALRAQMGTKAQKTVREHWLLSENIATWQDIYRADGPGFNHPRRAKTASAGLINAISGQLYWMGRVREELIGDLQQRNIALAGEVETSKEQLLQEHSALETTQVTLAGVQQELLSTRAELVLEQSSLHAVRTDLAREQRTLQSARATLAKLETAYQAKEKELAEAVEKDKDQQTRISTLQTQLDTASSGLHLLEEENAQLEIEVGGLKDQLQEKEIENQRLAGLVDEKLRQNQGLNDALSARTSELEAIKASRSWRVALFLKKVRSKVAPVDGRISKMTEKISSSLMRPITKVIRKVRLKRDLAMIKRSPLFDKEWYLETYPDVLKNGIDPAKHYMFFGAFEGRDPSLTFDSSEYLIAYPDVQKTGINPLVHYLSFGKKEGRDPKGLIVHENIPVISEASEHIEVSQVIEEENFFHQTYEELVEVAVKGVSDEFVPLNINKLITNESAIKAVAFYLPQFHPIPENDEWWGKGFTEWTNVSKAVPQFVGHYQPRLPGELGFYDLRIYDVQKRQIELARNYGIYGFCFHYYWFSGRRLLETPLDLFLEHSENEFPFCVCWANENWTKRWDGKEDDVLIAQEHSFENDKQFITDLEPILRDKRYIRIDGQPLIIIYRPGLIKEPLKTVQFWQKFCESKKLGKPMIVGAQTFGFTDPASIGFDASVEFPPHNILYKNISSQKTILNKDYQGSIYDYREMVEKNIDPLNCSYRVFRTVTPAWDNEARKPGRGFSFAGSTPKLYRQWLDQVCFEEMTNRPHKDNVVFVNAWNEWGEGAYLEPDRKFGYAYLQATYEAMMNSSKKRFLLRTGEFTFIPQKSKDTLVILHVYYTDLFDEIASYLENFPDGFDLIVSLPRSEIEFSKSIFKRFPDAQIFLTDNIGRDIAPFIEIFRSISDLKYKAIIKLHTKKSIHRGDGSEWRHDILNKLVGSTERIDRLKKELEQNQKVGLIGPKGHVLDHRVYWGFNKGKTLSLAKETGISIIDDPDFLFIAGSMFWARPEALNFLKILPVNTLDFEPEPTPPDGALAHAIERLIGLAAKVNGFTIKEVDENGNIVDPGEGNNYAFAVPFPQ